MSFVPRAHPRVRGRLAGIAGVVLAATVVLAPQAGAVEEVPASLSDLRVTSTSVSGTLLLRSEELLKVDNSSLKASVGGEDTTVTAQPAAAQARTTMLVIDTSGSMGATGMGTVRSAVRQFLDDAPEDVKVGVVSFADTAGVDVAPTTDRAQVRSSVAALRSDGETALYEAVQDAVAALGTEGERSIVLLSDGGDTVAAIEGGRAREASQRKAALQSLSKAKVRAEVVAFKSPEGNDNVLQQFAGVGGGSVANATDRKAVADAFAAVARTLQSQTVLDIKRPAGLSGVKGVVVSGTASGRPFEARAKVDLGDTAPLPSESPTPVAAPGDRGCGTDVSTCTLLAVSRRRDPHAGPVLPCGGFHGSCLPVSTGGASQRRRRLRVRPRRHAAAIEFVSRGDQRTARDDGRQGHVREGVHRPNDGPHRSRGSSLACR